jgi:hypothetical protein
MILAECRFQGQMNSTVGLRVYVRLCTVFPILAGSTSSVWRGSFHTAIYQRASLTSRESSGMGQRCEKQKRNDGARALRSQSSPRRVGPIEMRG